MGATATHAGATHDKPDLVARYDPVGRNDGRLVLRCHASSETDIADAEVRLRWYDDSGRLLVWETAPATLRLSPAGWTVLPVDLPVAPSGTGFLCFVLIVGRPNGLPARHVGFVQTAAAPAIANVEVSTLSVAPARPEGFASPDSLATAVMRVPFRRLSDDGSGLVVAEIDPALGATALRVAEWPGTGDGALTASLLPAAGSGPVLLALPEAGLRTPTARLIGETRDGRPRAVHLRAASARQPGIAVVVTSCGRQDLLRRTLDSFFARNSYPAAQVIVVEDGRSDANASLRAKYAAHRITWLATGRRVGQIAAIDYAYALVEHDYIFHLEDDWEFYESGFIEKSLAVLEAQPDCLQVWIRALNDTNRHPVAAAPERVAGVCVRRMLPGYLGKWHGFTFNPGLRRAADYDRIGKYGWHVGYDFADPDGSEWRLASLYRERGFHAVILADNHGKGYVRHLGFGRRVVDRTMIG